MYNVYVLIYWFIVNLTYIDIQSKKKKKTLYRHEFVYNNSNFCMKKGTEGRLLDVKVMVKKI